MTSSSKFDELLEHLGSIESYLNERLSESDTRALLIDPVLRILGYVSFPDLRREVQVPATKEALDYQLSVDGRPLAIVEAKALRHSINDQSAAQCVQYAALLGIRWCLITNGLDWALYDAYAKGPLGQKRVAEVRLSGSSEQMADAWKVLELFDKATAIKKDPFIGVLTERVLEDELKRSDSGLIQALQRAVRNRFGERVTGAELVRVLETRYGPTVAGAVTSSESPKPSERARTVRRSGADARIGDFQALVSAGLLPEDASIEMFVKGVSHPARLRGGSIELNGEKYTSLSAAAKSLAGYSVNGWDSWSFKGVKLSTLRNQLGSTGLAEAP